MRRIYKYANEDNSFFLEVSQVENEEKFAYERGLFRIIFCDTGEGYILKGGYKDKFTQQQLLFCNPYNSKIVFTQERNKAYIFSFSYELFTRLITKRKFEEFLPFLMNHESSAINLCSRGKDNILHLTKEILFEIENALSNKEAMLMLTMAKIVLLYKRELKSNSPKQEGLIPANGSTLIYDYFLLIERHYKSVHKVAEFAKMLNVSTITLSNAFRSEAVSPLQLIHKRLLIESKRLLEFSHLSIKEIAFTLGFKEPTHFHKFFKNQTSLSPGQFRKSTKGANLDVEN